MVTMVSPPKASLFKAAPSESRRGPPKPVPGAATVNVRVLTPEGELTGALSYNYMWRLQEDITISVYSRFLSSAFLRPWHTQRS